MSEMTSLSELTIKWANIVSVETTKEGWSSRVLLGCNRETNIPIALKCLRFPMCNEFGVSMDMFLHYAFLREAEALIECQNDRIPSFRALYSQGRHLALEMTRLEGKVLASERNWTWTRLRPIIHGLLIVLMDIHRRNWIHCDLNPTNILFGSSGVNLLDFGAAQPVSKPLQWEYPLGRHRYMGPEHLLGRFSRPSYPGLGPASDIHQIGCLILSLLTGAEPFREALDSEDYWYTYLSRLGEWSARPANLKLQDILENGTSAEIPSQLLEVLEWTIEPSLKQRCSSAESLYSHLKQL